MRGYLWLLLIGGIVGDLVGLAMWANVAPQADKAPAIVIVPQLILAAQIAGFGTLTSAVAAGALAIIATLERRSAAETAALAPTPSAPSRVVTDPYANERRLDPNFDPDRTCTRCGNIASIINNRCRSCGHVQSNRTA